MYDLGQLLIQTVELFKEGVCSEVIEEIGQIHDLRVEVKIEGCTRIRVRKDVTISVYT